MVGTEELPGNALVRGKSVDGPELLLVTLDLLVDRIGGLVLGRIDNPPGQDHGIRGTVEVEQTHHQVVTVHQHLLAGGVELGDADMPLGQTGRLGRQGWFHTHLIGQETGNGRIRRDGQVDDPGPRTDGRQNVLGVGGAEKPDGVGGGLLYLLEEDIGGPLQHPIHVLDDDDPPGRGGRHLLRGHDEFTNLIDADGDLVGRQDRYIGIGPGQDLLGDTAGLVVKTVIRTDQGRRKGTRQVRPPGSGRSANQPGLGHRVTVVSLRGDNLLEQGHRGLLPDDGIPDAHRAFLRRWPLKIPRAVTAVEGG